MTTPAAAAGIERNAVDNCNASLKLAPAVSTPGSAALACAPPQVALSTAPNLGGEGSAIDPVTSSQTSPSIIADYYLD